MPVEFIRPDPKGLLIGAPSSGAGKTTVTLALLRALKKRGTSVVSAKSGPDYIDPRFHEAASGQPCVNLDAWAMNAGTLQHLAGQQVAGSDLLLIEGAMGLFDGAANGNGSAADLASQLKVPVVLVIDCGKQAQSVAALVSGFLNFRSDISVTGVILNRVGSARHEQMLRSALAGTDVAVIGALPRTQELMLPERHLGLVQANEHPELECFLEKAADHCVNHLDLDMLCGLATGTDWDEGALKAHLPNPPGQRIAVARDIAFAFSYGHLLEHWQSLGADLNFFSPLADEQPAHNTDMIYLPGGYPELHAGRLAAAANFKASLQAAAKSGALIYGECGGYMTLGEGVVDAVGCRHEMLGLLPLETSFQQRKRHLGYRVVEPLGGALWTGTLMAHEFHYASIITEGQAERLFAASDAEGNVLPDMGLRSGNVMGSFAHVIASGQAVSSTTS